MERMLLTRFACFHVGAASPRAFSGLLHHSLDCCFPLLLVSALQGNCTAKNQLEVQGQSLQGGNSPRLLALGT